MDDFKNNDHQRRCANCKEIKKLREDFPSNGRKNISSQKKYRKICKMRIIKFYICEYLEKNPCVKCGEKDIRKLEFDHINVFNKRSDIAKMVHNKFSLHSIKNEIKKCQILCSNCHRLKTSIQYNFYKHKYIKGEL